MEGISVTPSWLAFFLSALVVVNNLAYIFYLQRFKVEKLEKDDTELKQQLKVLSTELAHIATQMKMSMTRQGIINHMSGKTLESLLHRLESMEEHLREWPGKVTEIREAREDEHE